MTYSEVEIRQHKDIDYFYVGEIIEFNFPDDLYLLIVEYDELVSQCALTLLDEVEEKIYFYDLKLKTLGEKIFNLRINDKSYVRFFVRYPTGSGFKDGHPF